MTSTLARSVVNLACAALILTGADAWAATKCKSGKKPEVFVKAKSPLRRGPGLNYPVTGFLERGRCLPLGEVSMDESWVLVEGAELFGWVPVGRLDAAGQKRAAAVKPDRAPVGSGQTRGHVWANASTDLRATPQDTAPTKKLLPEGSRLLAVATTGDGTWVQVRDERGEIGWVNARRIRDESGVLAGVPRTTRGVKVETVRIEEPVGPASTRTVMVPLQRGMLIDAQLLASMTAPMISVDTNGADAYRRYDISALAGGARIEAATSSLGPLHARFGYGLTILSGLNLDRVGDISGQHHEIRAAVGYPIEVGGLFVMPEVGYAYDNLDLDPVLPGDPIKSGGTFFSTRSHGGTAGVTFAYAVGESITLEFEGSMLLGTTSEYPIDLGQPKLTLGGFARAGARWSLADRFAMIVRYDFALRVAKFEGESTFDETITEATASQLTNGVSVGVVFGL